jgi:hypothetical protein
MSLPGLVPIAVFGLNAEPSNLVIHTPYAATAHGS